MIVTKKVKVKMNGKHISKYRNMGYECNVGDIIEVNIDDLPIKSKLEIEVCCDYCGNQKIVKYYTYSKSISLGKYSCSKCVSIKIKENNLKKYGVDSTNKLESTINKKKKTYFVKYGNYFNIEEVEKTKMEKYGDAKYNNREKAKKTMIEKYGVDNYRKTEEYKTKNKETNLKKYGVEHYSQNPIIFRKQQLGGFMAKKYGELYYRGKYELDFIKYCEKNTIQITNGPSIPYEMDGVQKIYHSDYYLPKYNLIIEIKSTYYYNKDLKKNLSKELGALKNGFDFIFVLDKKYDKFDKKIRED